MLCGQKAAQGNSKLYDRNKEAILNQNFAEFLEEKLKNNFL